MRFRLGERVTWTHDVAKDREPGRVTWIIGELNEPETGIIIGFRSLSDYSIENITEYDDMGMGVLARFNQSTIIPGTARRAWLVVKGMRNKPTLVLDQHIESE